MKNVLIRSSIIVLCFIILSSTSSFGEKFYLKDGDVITGELIGYQENAFQVKSKLGTITISVSEIVQMTGKSDQGIVNIFIGKPTVGEQDRITGTLESVKSGEIRITTDYGYVVINAFDKLANLILDPAAVKSLTKEVSPQGEEKKPSQQSTDAKDFTFRLNGCRVSGQSATCEMTVTNNKEERVLISDVYGSGRGHLLYDDLGNKYDSQKTWIANLEAGSDVSNRLVVGIPTKVGAKFEGISAEAKKIALLEFELRVADDVFLVQFRNFPLDR